MNKILLSATLFFSCATILATDGLQIVDLKKTKYFLADDGSEIRPMPGIDGVESVHCLLHPDEVIQASRHRTVSQIWYTLEGSGEMWLKAPGGRETTFPLDKGVSFTVPLGYAFQFRTTWRRDLEILIVNTTKWSGDGELIPVDNHWRPNHPKDRNSHG